jgi:hypothetical protein
MSTSSEKFSLDRARLREHLESTRDGEIGLVPAEEGGLAAAVAERLHDAQDAGAIGAVENVEVVAYDHDGHVLIALRELKAEPGSRAYRRQVSTYLLEVDHLATRGSDLDGCCAAVEACLERANALLPSLRLLQAAERQAAAAGEDLGGIVYFVDASASESLMDRGAPAPDQPTHVRFGPFESYVELTYEKLRSGPDGAVIGFFDPQSEVWTIDGLLFSDLAIAATDRTAAVSGSGARELGEAPTMRYPTVRY